MEDDENSREICLFTVLQPLKPRQACISQKTHLQVVKESCMLRPLSSTYDPFVQCKNLVRCCEVPLQSFQFPDRTLAMSCSKFGCFYSHSAPFLGGWSHGAAFSWSGWQLKDASCTSDHLKVHCSSIQTPRLSI